MLLPVDVASSSFQERPFQTGSCAEVRHMLTALYMSDFPRPRARISSAAAPAQQNLCGNVCAIQLVTLELQLSGLEDSHRTRRPGVPGSESVYPGYAECCTHVAV